jgi:hypothetical protein
MMIPSKTISEIMVDVLVFSWNETGCIWFYQTWLSQAGGFE